MKRHNRVLIPIFCIALITVVASCGGGGGGGASSVSGAQCPAGVTPPTGLNPDIIVSASTGSNTTATGSCTAPYQTITAALGTAASGGTIWVAPGTYDAALGETFPLILPAGVQLVGDTLSRGTGSGTNSTVIHGMGTVGMGGFFAAVTAPPDTGVGGFLFTQPTPGPLDSYGVYGVGGDIANNTFSNTLYGGVRINSNGVARVHDNSFHSSSYGIYHAYSATAAIRNNIFTGPSIEIDVQSGNPIIENNEFRTGALVGIQVRNSMPEIRYNTFVSDGYPAHGAINYWLGGGGYVRSNSFFLESGPAIKIRSTNTTIPDLGNSAYFGQNVFGGASTVSVVHEANTIVNAVGNTWHTSPPVCGTEILTSGTGVVFWAVANRCPF